MPMNKITKDSFALLPAVDMSDKSAVYDVEIKVPPYEGVVVRYGSVKIQVTETAESGENGKLSFVYYILKGDKNSLSNDRTFANLTGDILAYIIHDALDSGKYQIGDPSKPSHVEPTTADDSSEARQ
jgi:hypothetical protein